MKIKKENGELCKNLNKKVFKKIDGLCLVRNWNNLHISTLFSNKYLEMYDKKEENVLVLIS